MKKRRKVARIFSSTENVRILLGTVLMIVLALVFVLVGETFTIADFIEISTFSAIVIAFLFDSIIKKIAAHFRKGGEDENKLTTDYDKLVGKYSRVTSFVCVENEGADDRNRQVGRKITGCKFKSKKQEDVDKFVLPVCDKIPLKNKKIEIYDDNQKMYEPCSYVWEHMDLLSKIHEFSYKYNNTNIRVDRIIEDEETVLIKTSRTKYFYSLMTNRSMDYQINDISYREMFEEGPFLRELENSTLSNHLGFNGYVETEDGKFVFVVRHDRATIGKNMIQNSIGASLKTKYALDENKKLTVAGIMNAIQNEIIDELKLEKLADFASRKGAIFRNFSFRENVLYFYRDVVEGGKPQLMFYAKLPIHSDELLSVYTEKKAKRNTDAEIYTLVDGHQLVLVNREDLGKIYLAPDAMVINGKAYQAMPSSVASHSMLMEYLNSENG